MCAIAGAAFIENAATYVATALHTLQHRGQESAGIVSTDGDKQFICRRRGIVSEIFRNDIPGLLSSLAGHAAIGHTRYSTTGGDLEANIQPLSMQSRIGWMAIAHNGNLVNFRELATALEHQGSIFQTTTDTEIIMHLIARCPDRTLPEALVCALEQVEGAYSIVVLNKRYMIAVRDPHGFRPLLYGKYNDGTVFASESCAFDIMGCKPIREVDPGEMIVVNLETGEVEVRQVFKQRPIKQCVFEMIYFSRPDSNTFGKSVYEVRKALGRRLSQEQPARADIVVPVPDSGISAALGYAEELGLPFEMGLVRSHYLGRSFLQPKQSLRDFSVHLKLNAVRSCIEGKSLAVVDDSLVRGTTSKKIIRMLRESGAREIHFRISAPPTISPCFYGIDTPTKEELIGANASIDEIRQFIEADSIGYLSVDGLSEVVGNKFCSSCFDKTYPTPLYSLQVL